MGKIFNFWWRCVKRAAGRSSAFANDWQWFFSFPSLARLFGCPTARSAKLCHLNTDTALGALAAAGAAFIITWIVAFIVHVFRITAEFYYGEKEKADKLDNQIRDVGMERTLCYTTVRVVSFDDVTGTSYNPNVEVWFENIGNKMLSHEVNEMSIQINGIDCLLGDPSPKNNLSYIHAGKSFGCHFPTTISIPKDTFPIVIKIGFKAEYDNVPPIKTRFTRRVVQYVFFSINPVQCQNSILEAEEG